MQSDTALFPAAVWHPDDAGEVHRLMRKFGDNGVIVSGGTLLRTQWESGLKRMPANLIDLRAIGGITGLSLSSGFLEIGSRTTLAECRRHPLLLKNFPLLTEAVRSIGAPSIRNLATIGGNIASAVGDSLPALLLFDTELIWYGCAGLLPAQPLEEWLTVGGTAAPLGLLLQVRLPMKETREKENEQIASAPAQGKKCFAAYHKVGRREAFTPSVVTTAVSGEVDPHGRFRGVRMAAGGGQTIPGRFRGLELWLEGKAADDETISELHEKLMEQFAPNPDAFATTEYRRRTAAHLITADLWQAAHPDLQKEGSPCS